MVSRVFSNARLYIFVVVCRLALYVYEYLIHSGAQKSAQTFLSEVCSAIHLLMHENLKQSVNNFAITWVNSVFIPTDGIRYERAEMRTMPII